MTIIEILKMFLFFLGFIPFFLILNKLEKNQKINLELNRKILHIGAGFGGSILPFLFDKKTPGIILSIFFIILLISMRFIKNNKMKKFEGIKIIVEMKTRKTYGDIYLVISILGLWIFSENRIMYLLPLLILMFSDAFAALIGEFYSKYKFDTGFGQKSIEGSIVFFLTTYFLCINFFILFTNIKDEKAILLSFILSVLTMILEIISWNGLDNVFIPFFVYLFLKLNINLDSKILLSKIFILFFLLLVIYLNRKKTTLTKTAQTGSLFFMYLITIIGGINWLIPPLITYLIYYHFTPKVEGQEKDKLKALIFLGVNNLVLTILSLKINEKKIFLIYILAFSLYFGIINLIRCNAVFKTDNDFSWKFYFLSIFKAYLFFIINYFLLVDSLKINLLLEKLIFIIIGISSYVLVLKIIYKKRKKDKLSGEQKLILTSIIIFIICLIMIVF